MREKNGEKTKIAVRAVKAYISRNQFCRSRGRSHTVYIFVPDPQMHSPHGPTCKRTDGHTDGRMDMQKHGRTCRRADGHAEAWTQMQTHGRRRRSTDADARTQTQAPDGARTLNIHACSAWVEKSSRRILRLDERTRTFEVYYIYVICIIHTMYVICIITSAMKSTKVQTLGVICMY